MGKRLEDKVSIITGGAMGIGRAIALKFAFEGSVIVVADINVKEMEKTVKQIRKMGGKAISCFIDLFKIKEIKPMIVDVVKTYGKLDILVNAAGIVKNEPFLQISEESWDRIVALNMKSTMFCIQAAAEQMIKQIPEKVKKSKKTFKSFGKIVNFSSISGRRGRSFQAHYAAAKAAIISITQSAALAFAKYNINVNAIAPSIVKTSMVKQLFKEQSRILKIDQKTAEKILIEKIPLMRPGSLEDMAMTATFLCSSDSDYITGQTINVDGGFEMN